MPEPRIVPINRDASYAIGVGVYDGERLLTLRVDDGNEVALAYFDRAHAVRFRADFDVELAKLAGEATVQPNETMLVRSLRRTFELVEELKKTNPAGAANIYAITIAQVRSACPQAFSAEIAAVTP